MVSLPLALSNAVHKPGKTNGEPAEASATLIAHLQVGVSCVLVDRPGRPRYLESFWLEKRVQSFLARNRPEPDWCAAPLRESRGNTGERHGRHADAC